MLDGYDLLIPGPTTLDPTVLQEMVRPVVPHYGAAWTAYYQETIGLLKNVFDTSGPVFAIPGSGSAGLDAAISSCIGSKDRLLILANGFFGDRLAEIATSHFPETAIEQLSVDEPITDSRLLDALAKHPAITAVMVVHSESSSGLLNPIESLGALCRERGVTFLVDAISSLGGVELSMDRMNIDVCVSASQKCLEGPPGLGLVAVAPQAWSRMKAYATRGWYLSLQTWQRYADKWADWHPYPITMAVPALRALRRGLERVLDEGLSARWLRHREMAAWLMARTAALGFEGVFPENRASPTVIALRPPEGLSVETVMARLREDHNLLIAGGMGSYKGKAFRIGNMGVQASIARLQPFVDALELIVAQERSERNV